jgi:hypothetical protein
VQFASLGNPEHENVTELEANPEKVKVVEPVDPGAETVTVVGLAVNAAATTVIERLADDDSGVLSESVSVTVKLLVPTCVEVPEIAPVAELRDRPPGKVPEVTLHL